MKFKRVCEYGSVKEFCSEITEELDNLSNLNSNDFMNHYVMIDRYYINARSLPIRVPGETIGSIHYDDNNIITNIKINTYYPITKYPKNINVIMSKYIGEKIEF